MSVAYNLRIGRKLEEYIKADDAADYAERCLTYDAGDGADYAADYVVDDAAGDGRQAHGDDVGDDNSHRRNDQAHSLSQT